jgi:putative solute:sodium symporter small subunit
MTSMLQPVRAPMRVSQPCLAGDAAYHAGMGTSRYWQRTRRMTVALLVVWFIVTFTASFFARALNEWRFLGFPLGFYMSAQGVLLVYLAIVWFYARYMDRLDDQARPREEQDMHLPD